MTAWQRFARQEWLWGTKEPWKTALFKRLPEGWLFRSPVCWWPFGLGPHPHFILNDTQQAEVESAFRHINWRLTGLVVAMALLGAPLLWFARTLSHDFELGLLIGVACYTLYFQIVLNVHWQLLLRRPLTDALRTNERIGFAERYGALAASMPSSGLNYLAIICAVLAALEMHSFVTAKGLGVMSLVGMILCGALAIGCIVMLLAKRQPRT